MIVNPTLLYQNSKKIFSQNVSTLSMPIKWGLLFLVALFVIDNVLGFSQGLIVNGKIDTIKHLYEGTGKQYIEDYDALNQEIVNSKSFFAITAESFSFFTNNDNRIPIINSLTVAIIPIVLFVILLFHFIEGLVIKRDGQLERLINILLLLVCVFGLFHVMLSLSIIIPTFPRGYLWGNYVINIFMSLILYLIICGIITNLSDKIMGNISPQADEHVVVEETNEQQGQEVGGVASVQPDVQ